jgi:putative ABC transport system ATP-binding protein
METSVTTTESGCAPPAASRDRAAAARNWAPGNPLITLSGVTKRYRTSDLETTALDDIDLVIREGEFVAVMGPSGCGKSTLLNIVGLVDAPSSGRFRFGRHEISGYGESKIAALRKGRVGFVFQSFNLIEELTVYGNVELPLLYCGVPKAQRVRLIWDALDMVGLRARAKHKPGQLSGGQQQRVAIARAIVGGPQLILADEPTGNLDTRSGEQVMRMLEVLNRQGATILMVTHSPAHAERANRIVRLLDGRIVSTAASGP